MCELSGASRFAARHAAGASSANKPCFGTAFELDRSHDPILLSDDQTVRRSEVFGETRIAGAGGMALFQVG
jgi:hypothetical protein